MKRLTGSLARNQSLSISTACQRLCSDGQAAGAKPASNERSAVKRAAASSENGVVSDYGGVRRERKRSTLSLPTVSALEELQKALKKVLEAYPSKLLVTDGQLLCRHLMSRKNLSRVQESRKRRGLIRAVPASPWKGKRKYRDEDTVESVLRYGSRQTVAYAASRLQAVYGATLRVLSEIAKRDPSFCPETMLDFGSGLGTAVWAAHQLWSGSLYESQTVDTSKDMGDMARRLRRGGEEKEEGKEWETGHQQEQALPGVYFRQYLPTSNLVLYDLVTACYTLGDLQSSRLKNLSLSALWRKTKNYLVLIEPGNNTGFQNIIGARDFVLNAPGWISPSYSTSSADEGRGSESLEGHVFAPCPHSLKCPLAEAGSIPCHFGQRVMLDFCDKETLKHKGHKIELFSYVVLKKGKEGGEREEQYSRLIQPVKKRTKHIVSELCCPDGKVRQLVYTKSKHGDLYRMGRHSNWGDLVPYSQEEDFDCESVS